MWQPNRLEQDRLDKAQRLEEKNISLYPPRAKRSHTTAEVIALFEQQEQEATESEIIVTVVGRIRRINIKGKVSFMHIEDESGRIQLFLRLNDMDEDSYQLVKEKLIETDDFVQATGTLMKTKTGEISIRVNEFSLLAKSLSPLPVVKQQTNEDGSITEYGEFSDVEQRYRQRYADLAVNQDVREVFQKRSRIIRAMRDFLDNEGMLEVETPILQPIYGGAAARPFTTHHNQLHQDLFLRISYELYLKRLLAGGFDAVYEIGRDFRNEGVSYKHNPEFTMMEFYKAYIDYTGVMDILERMIAYIAGQVFGTSSITYQGQEIDLTPPWQRITIREAVKQHTPNNFDYMDYPDRDSLEEAIRTQLGTVKPEQTWGWMVVEHLLGEFVEPNIVQPTIIMDYPQDISPFAKKVEYDDIHVERFECFIAGMEMGNAFTELNDPRDQEERFLEMKKLYSDESDEATPLDEDYLRAMRYGMPPMGGLGIGVDRFVMLLTDQRNIRDVLLFPHLRREEK